ncbi:MAG: ankyrin repeat domain-containing protein [Acidobacteria bacterium]|nr:ankyrin repeat domain-containing protein [Acidobacteriota bacterium]
MDRNQKAALILVAAVLGFWAWTGGNETLAESSVREKPLLRAAYAGDVDELKRLLAAGANVSEMDRMGRTALHHAVNLESVNHYPEGNHVACVQALLKAGAKADQRTADGTEAPLYGAVHNPDMVEALLAAGADAHFGMQYRPALIAAAYFGAGMCTKATESMRLLLKAGADVNAAESGGFTALSAAAVYGCPGMVKLLLDSGARVDHRMQNGQTLLEWVKMAQAMHQGTLLGTGGKQVHADNWKLLETAAAQAARTR